jgi:nucleoside diphosphate kinase
MREIDLDWQQLTALRAKRALYPDDSFFREGYSDWSASLGKDTRPCLLRTAMVLFKPEAVAGRRIAVASGLLEQRGFVPVAAQVVRFDRTLYHSLYRYQLRRATRDKVRLYTRWVAGLPALMVAYLDTSPMIGIPASVRLKMIKGPAVVDRRRGDDLRSLLRSTNSIINFVHSADEPADLLREVPICVRADRREGFLRDIRAADTTGGSIALRRLIARLDRRVPEHDMDPHAAGRRIRGLAAGEADHPSRGPVSRECIAMVDEVLSGKSVLNLSAFEGTLRSLLDRVDPFDVYVFGAEFIERDRPGEQGDLDEDCVSCWLSAAQTAGETR